MQQPHPDHIYIEALLKNDRRLLDELYKTFAPRVKSFVGANSGTSDDAADVMQEALLAVLRYVRSRPEFVLTCPFKNFFYIVYEGKWFNELRRRKNQQLTMDRSKGYSTEDPFAYNLAQEILTQESRAKVYDSCFAKLPKTCREILERLFSGNNLKETAADLGLNYGYIRGHKLDCEQKLIQCVQTNPGFNQL